MSYWNQERYRLRRWGILGGCAIAIAVTSFACNSVRAIGNTALDANTQQAMVDAINDEYRARAFYNAVIERFGSVRPFSNIVQAEERHVQLWNTIFAQYGLPVPPDTFAGNLTAPDTLQAACQLGVEAEIANVQMYDNFLSVVQEPDLRSVFTQLRTVSQNNHQPAFERCGGGAPAQQGPPWNRASNGERSGSQPRWGRLH